MNGISGSARSRGFRAKSSSDVSRYSGNSHSNRKKVNVYQLPDTVNVHVHINKGGTITSLLWTGDLMSMLTGNDTFFE